MLTMKLELLRLPDPLPGLCPVSGLPAMSPQLWRKIDTCAERDNSMRTLYADHACVRFTNRPNIRVHFSHQTIRVVARLSLKPR